MSNSPRSSPSRLSNTLKQIGCLLWILMTWVAAGLLGYFWFGE